MAFKLVVKDGDTKYIYNEKTGQYTNKTIDYVEEHADLAGGLLSLLEWLGDDYNENKITLTFTPDKKKDKKSK